MKSATILCGIDVAAKTLAIALDMDGKVRDLELPNTAKGHEKLVRLLAPAGTARVCMEATGRYNRDVAARLQREAGVEVMVVNPRRIKDYAKALAVRSRNDQVDARTILDFLRRMEFEPWTPPSPAVDQLRLVTRRIDELTKLRTMEKNRRHAAKAAKSCSSKRVERGIDTLIRLLSKEITALREHAKALVRQDPQLERSVRLAISVPGISWASGLPLIAELGALPADLTPAQWVSQAGLDPKSHTSGTSVNHPARISKEGNHHLRRPLFMPAMCLIQRNPNARAFRDALLSRGKTKLQAVVAVMRKLLRCLHGMLRTNTAWEPNRFRVLPTGA